MQTPKKLTVYFFSIALVFFSIITSCQKRANEKLYMESKAPDLSFYKTKDSIYGPEGGSPHGSFKLKFNSTALSALGVDGKLPTGAEFPKGSLIVKEVYDGSTLSLYAIMKKDPTSKYAASGWVWAEYDAGGNTVYNVTKEGSGCTSCHSVNPARDYTRSFDLH